MQGSRISALAAAFLLPLPLIVACSGGSGVVVVPRSPTATATPDPPPSPQGPATATPVLSATPDADGVYLVPCGDLLAPLDKLHRLAADCEPQGLQPIPEAFAYGPQSLHEPALAALVEMLEAAAADGHRTVVVSSYRSYEQQRGAFRYHVDTFGLEAAARLSARPGHSEHQLGTTVDLSSASVGYELTEAFGRTPEGRWLAERAHEFGFVLSYPEGREQVTGYAYEPWHLRWVGRETAAAVHASGLTLTEFLRR